MAHIEALKLRLDSPVNGKKKSTPSLPLGRVCGALLNWRDDDKLSDADIWVPKVKLIK